MSEYVFDLYIAGHTSRSKQAARNIQDFCEQFFPGDYDLNLIDVLEDPERAEEEKIIATPTLVQRAPIAGRRIIGVVSDHQAMLQALGLEDLQEEF
ncbi:MAG: circadian clock KaiB family protein [Desulfohalobiaceae bacterium]